MQHFIYFFVFLFVFKLLSNLIYWIKAKLFSDKYHEWLFQNDKIDMFTRKATFRTIMKRAGVKDYKIPMSQATGYGQVTTALISVIDVFPSRIEDHAVMATRMLDEAVGVYKQRTLETFNPLFWIESVIFLPRTLFEYLGVNSDNIAVKIMNIIWWIAAPISFAYRKGISDFILNSFSSTN